MKPVIFDAQLYSLPSTNAWVFVSLPLDASDEIRERTSVPRPGFGSVYVTATIGSTTWTTSIFPESGGGPYVLPVKKTVRSAEGIAVGDTATVTVEIDLSRY
ncbi:protein of unknown function [Agreia bicolorata]|uniref:DUF1905 domain-containing protein n=1 Tax=Agreia bicolorata TaxID=110935 RepID=A0A1T4Y8K1_9MICO|nr:DUF1905 domain-containing protein [Agreia bicolorata]SKA98020.1 protein of unknown function [Agreia bicolorata]